MKIGLSPDAGPSVEQEYLQHVDFVPGGKGLVAVANNDIYYLPDLRGTTAHRVTYTGSPATIYNGVADSLYEGVYFSLLQQ